MTWTLAISVAATLIGGAFSITPHAESQVEPPARQLPVPAPSGSGQLLVVPPAQPWRSLPITVPGTANIFLAGLKTPPNLPGGAGTIPRSVPIPSFERPVTLTFPSVVGLTNCCGNTPNSPPDGGPDYRSTNLTSFNGVSGIKGPKDMFLVGVFTGGSRNSGRVPPTLNFNSARIRRSASLSPHLFQTFFVGTGLTDAGTVRQFVVPRGATKLFLGFADGFAFMGAPESYGDNKGALTVTLKFATR